MSNFTHRLAQLTGTKCEAVDAIEYEQQSATDIYSVGTTLQFTDRTKLRAHSGG